MHNNHLLIKHRFVDTFYTVHRYHHPFDNITFLSSKIITYLKIRVNCKYLQNLFLMLVTINIIPFYILNITHICKNLHCFCRTGFESVVHLLMKAVNLGGKWRKAKAHCVKSLNYCGQRLNRCGFSGCIVHKHTNTIFPLSSV